jgi:hypothetical protein
MTRSSSRRKRIALAVAAATLAAGAWVMTAVFAHPTAVATGVLGTDWECKRIVWVTSCTRIEPDAPAVRVWQKEPSSRSPV